MGKSNKRLNADRELVPANPVPLDEAVAVLKKFKTTKFDQSVDISLDLGIDVKQADQAIRGAVSLPHGLGRSKRVIAFCPMEKVEEAKAAGAVEAGAEDLVKKIEDGWLDFDVAIADPPMMRVISKLGRALGPKGLMPSPKNGTVTPNVTEAVKEFAAGKVEFKNDKQGSVHASIGRISFPPEQIKENAEAFIHHIEKMKPASTKGVFMKKVSLSGTMTPGVSLAL